MEKLRVGKILELPLADASALARLMGNAPGISKLRHELVRKLHWKSHRVSLGKWGTRSLNTPPMLGCLATGWRWDRRSALELGRCYNKAGLDDLFHTKAYSHALDEVIDSLRRAVDQVDTQPNINRLLGVTMNELIETSVEVREVAQQMTEITAEVDAHLGQVQRYVGHVERIEGGEALVVLESARKELRSVQAETLSEMGIQEQGDLFFLYQYQWSPDTVASFYMPAIWAEPATERLARLRALEKRLKEHETPLPQRDRPAVTAAATVDAVSDLAEK